MATEYEQALEALQVAKQLAERRVDEGRAEVRALREALGKVFATIDEWVEAGIVILDDDDFRAARVLAAEPAS